MYSFGDVTYKKYLFLHLPFGDLASINYHISHTGTLNWSFEFVY